MAYLVALVVVVGAIAFIDLALTAAIIRRLREHEQGGLPRDPLGGIPVGQSFAHFRTRTLHGDTLTDSDLRGVSSVVAFLSTECPSCFERAPEFAAYARSVVASGGQAVAVIIDAGGRSVEELVSVVGDVTVVVEPRDRTGPMTRAFAARTYPSFFVTDATGTVTSREINEQMKLMLFGSA